MILSCLRWIYTQQWRQQGADFLGNRLLIASCPQITTLQQRRQYRRVDPAEGTGGNQRITCPKAQTCLSCSTLASRPCSSSRAPPAQARTCLFRKLPSALACTRRRGVCGGGQGAVGVHHAQRPGPATAVGHVPPGALHRHAAAARHRPGRLEPVRSGRLVFVRVPNSIGGPTGVNLSDGPCLPYVCPEA